MISPTQPLIITIDGPAGTGKSSVAHMLAMRLGLEFLDTGAMYRAAALLAIENSITIDDGESIATALASTTLVFDWKSSPPRLLLSGRDVSPFIRTAEVTEAVSPVSACSDVRREMVRRQREIASAHPRLVTEGRDQGSVVFPRAEIKVYLTASPEERARRRHREEVSRGLDATVAVVLASQSQRDAADASRTVGTMRQADDAVLLETDGLSAEEVVQRLVEMVEDYYRRRSGA